MIIFKHHKISSVRSKLTSAVYLKGYRYLIYNAIAFVFVLLLNVLFPLFYDSEIYGFFVLQLSIYSFLLPIFVFGLDSAIFRYFFVDYFPSKKLLYSTVYYSWLIIGLLLLFISVILIFFTSLEDVLKIQRADLAFITFASFLSAPLEIAISSFIAQEKPRQFGVLLIGSKFLQIVVLLLLPVIFNLSKEWFSILFLCFSVLNLIIAFSFCSWNMRIPTIKQLKEISRFSAPLSLNSVFSFGFSHGFKILISPVLSFTQLGILNIIIQFGSMFTIVSNSMANSYNPIFFKQLLNIKQTLTLLIRPYFIFIFFNGAILIVPILAVGMPFLYYYNEGIFRSGTFLLPILMIGMFSFSFKAVGNGLLNFYKLTHICAIITALLSVFNILIGIYLTKQLGLLGAVLALSLGYFLQGLLFNLIGVYKGHNERKNT